jgi:hypothetical protein
LGLFKPTKKVKEKREQLQLEFRDWMVQVWR